MNPYAHIYERRKYGQQNHVLKMIILSTLCHFVVLAGFLGIPDFKPDNRFLDSVVQVDLVTMQAPEPEPSPSRQDKAVTSQEDIEAVRDGHEEPAPVKKPEKVPETAPDSPKGDKVSLAPRPLKVKRALKKKTFKASRIIKNAIANIEKNLYQTRSLKILNAVDQIKRKLEASKGGTSNAGMDKKTLDLMDIYNVEIWRHIQKQWAFSGKLAHDWTDLEAIVIVKIMPDGNIRDIWFEERSGNTYFDDSVLRAVKKASPLPPLPNAYIRPYYEVGLRFNLSELQQN